MILVETSHPGNIGSAARAMKTMGMDDLTLVSPKYFPADNAIAMAAGAEDLLDTATVTNNLTDAIQGCVRVYGMTARPRTLANPALSLREAAEEAALRLQQGERIAWVFGRERSGLTNEELDRCHRLVNINANPNYSSLNLAAAVQLAAYETRVALEAAMSSEGDAPELRALPPADDLERFYAHLEEVLVQIDFLDPKNPRHLLRRLRNLFGRAELDANELNILRGVLAHVSKTIKPGSH